MEVPEFAKSMEDGGMMLQLVFLHVAIGEHWCYNNLLNFFSSVATSDSYYCITFL
jgi:hypothetical protein